MFICKVILLLLLLTCTKCRMFKELHFSLLDHDFDDISFACNEFKRLVDMIKLNVQEKNVQNFAESLTFNNLLNDTKNKNEKIKEIINTYLAVNQLDVDPSASIADVHLSGHKTDGNFRSTKRRSLLDILSFILERPTDINENDADNSPILIEDDGENYQVGSQYDTFDEDECETLMGLDENRDVLKPLESEQFLDGSSAYFDVTSTAFDENRSEDLIPVIADMEVHEVDHASAFEQLLDSNTNVNLDFVDLNDPNFAEEVLALVSENIPDEDIQSLQSLFDGEIVAAASETFPKSNAEETDNVTTIVTLEEPLELEVVLEDLHPDSVILQGYDPSGEPTAAEIMDLIIDEVWSSDDVTNDSRDSADETFEHVSSEEKLLPDSDLLEALHSSETNHSEAINSKDNTPQDLESEGVLVVLNEVQGNPQADIDHQDLDDEFSVLNHSVLKPKSSEESLGAIVVPKPASSYKISET